MGYVGEFRQWTWLNRQIPREWLVKRLYHFYRWELVCSLGCNGDLLICFQEKHTMILLLFHVIRLFRCSTDHSIFWVDWFCIFLIIVYFYPHTQNCKRVDRFYLWLFTQKSSTFTKAICSQHSQHLNLNSTFANGPRSLSVISSSPMAKDLVKEKNLIF